MASTKGEHKELVRRIDDELNDVDVDVSNKPHGVDMERREPPPTAEGWFALHDFRRVNWDTWRGASEDERGRAIEEGRAYLETVEGVEDSEEGASVTYAIAGHKADILVVHFRPTMGDVEALERRFERTALADYTERAHSYIAMTEVSVYTSPKSFGEDDNDVEGDGLGNYLRMRLYPTIPEADYVCFYPMSKRRDPGYNWYDLPFEERAAYVASRDEIGRAYADEVTQVVTGGVGLDDWEQGVTLFANDPTRIKRLLSELRFDPSTSRFVEFGPFSVGRRLHPADLDTYLAGEALGEEEVEIPTGTPEAAEDDAAGALHTGAENVRAAIDDLDVYVGRLEGDDVYILVVLSEADPGELFEAVKRMRENFDHSRAHRKTAVYEGRDEDRAAVVSHWETQREVETAAGFLAELPGVVDWPDEEDGFGTMGRPVASFYTVTPGRRETWIERYEIVVERLLETEGFREITLLANREDENDVFLASRWDAHEDALKFTRSETFQEISRWGVKLTKD